MQVNMPDKGVFKGIGNLDKHLNINKRNFPLVRNKHQFQYTHNHGNFYQSSFNYFHRSKFQPLSSTNRFNQEKVNKTSNKSEIVLGNDKVDFKSQNQANFTKYQNYKPLKPIKRKEEGFDLGNEPNSNLFKTFNQEVFSTGRSLSSKQNITYKDWRAGQKFNPITGEAKNVQSSYGFEDFKYNGDKERKYRANNFTRVPRGGQRFDIISGRKLPY